jgi:pimeloyl-ACP methyl ester carboxylesterase
MKYCLIVTLCFFGFRLYAQETRFSEKETWVISGRDTLYGTVTEPLNLKRFPVVLLIAGSGPTDRNGNNPQMKNDALKQVGYALAEEGIASVRYDKRGIAASRSAGISEKDLRFENYIIDAEAWINALRKTDRYTTVIVAGHSEGSLIGMVAAKKADKFISIAGAGRSIDIVLKEQLINQPQPVKEHAFGILDTLKMGIHPTTVNPLVFSLFRPSIQPYMISWIKYDPAKQIDTLNQLKIPVLIIQGTRDIQVSVKDAELLKAANPSAQLLLIEQMNHVLRKVEDNRNVNLATYYKTDPPIEKELTDAIIKFIKLK